MTRPSPFSDLRAWRRDEARPQFVHADRVVARGQLCVDAAALAGELARADAGDWALYHADAYPFAVALLAVLGSGGRAWLPADATEGTAEKLAAHCDGWLGTAWTGGAAVPIERTDGDADLPPLTGEVVVFTSGSTGEPQPIVKHPDQLGREVEGLEQVWGGRLGDARVLGTVSHQHIYGLLFRVLWPLCAGRTSRSERFVESADLLRAVAGGEPAAWVSSPAHLRRLPEDAAWRAASGRLRAVFSSGGPLPADSAAACARLAGDWPIEVYGSSESGGIGWRTQADGNTAWQPLPGVRVRAGADGALELASPHLADTGWHRMSDAVEVEGDGRFRLGERLDRIVKVEGKRLSLTELEGALREHGWIADARALLLRRRRESVAAVAVPTADGATALAARGRHAFTRELRRGLASAFDPVTLPRLWRFVDALPADAQGKVADRDLAALFERRGTRRLPECLGVDAAGARCAVSLRVPPDLDCLEGHFPGLPVVPGIALIGWAEHYAREHLGVTGEIRDIERIKFSRLVRPGHCLELELERDDGRDAIGYRFRARAGGGDFASGRFRLARPHHEAPAAS